MNKTKVLIIVAIVLVVALGAGGAVGYAIMTKSSVTLEQFEKKAEAMELEDGATYTLTDAGEMNNVKKATIASNGNKYKLYFMEMDSDKAACNAFQANVDGFKIFEVPADGIVGELKEGLNYKTYTLVTGGKYYLLSRVKDTFVFAYVDRAYMDEVNTLIDELGYL